MTTRLALSAAFALLLASCGQPIYVGDQLMYDPATAAAGRTAAAASAPDECQRLALRAALDGRERRRRRAAPHEHLRIGGWSGGRT